MSKAKKSDSTKTKAPKKKKTKIKRTGKPSCPACGGEHWMENCPDAAAGAF